MFRIIQLTIDSKSLIDVAESRRTTVDALRKYVDLGRDGKNFVSEPMATTSAKYFDAEQCLRSIFGDRIHWDVKDLTADYKLFRTRAPVDYDYGYVVEIGRMDGRDKEERLVAIPHKSVEYQSGRYASGMFTPVDCS